MTKTAATAELALLVEATAAPTPGNVSRQRDLPDLRFEQFLAGSVGARDGLLAAAAGTSLGPAFNQAVEGMARRAATNTQFGALLLLTPLVAAAGRSDRTLCPSDARTLVETTTVADAVAFYEAFEYVDIRVPEPPTDTPVPDIRDGATAGDTLRRHDLTLFDILQPAADRGGVATELVAGFEWTFRAADWLAHSSGPISRRASAVHLWLLAARPDPLVVTAHGEHVAETVREHAAALLPPDADPTDISEALAPSTDATAVDRAAIADFARSLAADDINPGATADLLAGGLFVALHREEVTV